MSVDVYVVDLLFRAKEMIFSLPLYHGARWTALLRFACKSVHLRMEDLILGILPLRHGKQFIYKNEILKLRIFLNTAGSNNLSTFIEGIRNNTVEGLFSPRSLQLEDIISLYTPFSLQCLEKEWTSLQKLTAWHIIFYVPLRLTLPAGYKKVQRDRDRYCPPEFFNLGKIAIAHLLNHIRWQDSLGEAEAYFDIVKNDLKWMNMRYGQERHIILGGLTGQLCCSGQLCDNVAQRLVLGTYFGAGKNARFGLGWWRIPELNKLTLQTDI